MGIIPHRNAKVSMSRDIAKFKPSDRVRFGLRRIVITSIGNFGAEPHYGFIEGMADGSDAICGWVPVIWIDEIGILIKVGGAS